MAAEDGFPCHAHIAMEATELRYCKGVGKELVKWFTTFYTSQLGLSTFAELVVKT